MLRAHHQTHIFSSICLVAEEVVNAFILFFVLITSFGCFVLCSETPTHPLPNWSCLLWVITLLLLRFMYDSLSRAFLFLKYIFASFPVTFTIHTVSWPSTLYRMYSSAGLNSPSRYYYKYWRTVFKYLHIVLLIIWGIYLRKCWFCTYIDYEDAKMF